MSDQAKKPSAFASRGGGVLRSQRSVLAQRVSDASLQRVRGTSGSSAGTPRAGGNPALAAAMRLGLPVAGSQGGAGTRERRISPRDGTSGRSPRGAGPSPREQATAASMAMRSGQAPGFTRAEERPRTRPLSAGGERGRGKRFAAPHATDGQPSAPRQPAAVAMKPADLEMGKSSGTQPVTLQQPQARITPSVQNPASQPQPESRAPASGVMAPQFGFYQASHGIPSPKVWHGAAFPSLHQPALGSWLRELECSLHYCRPMFGQSALAGDAKTATAPNPFTLLASQGTDAGAAQGTGFGLGGSAFPAASPTGAFSGGGFAQTASRPLIGSVPKMSGAESGGFPSAAPSFGKDTTRPFLPFGNHPGALPPTGLPGQASIRSPKGLPVFGVGSRPLVGTVEETRQVLSPETAPPAVEAPTEMRVIRGRGEKMGSEGLLGRGTGNFQSGLLTKVRDQDGGGTARLGLQGSRVGTGPRAGEFAAAASVEEGKQEGPSPSLSTFPPPTSPGPKPAGCCAGAWQGDCGSS
eukprot:jgi/Botrbrau1/19374/Bobra.0338s0008.1